MIPFEFLIPRRPLSQQAKSSSLQVWKAFVRTEARKAWAGPPLQVGDFQITLIYLCTEAPPDIDNIIKPIQDALVGLVFVDDSLICDVDGHRRFLDGVFDITRLPKLLLSGIANQVECVYVRIQSSKLLEHYL
jgi:hypothetical protein